MGIADRITDMIRHGRAAERLTVERAMELYVPPGGTTNHDWNHVMERTWAEDEWHQLVDEVEQTGRLPRPVRVTRDGLWEVLDDDGRRLMVAAAREGVDVLIVEDTDG